MAQVTSGAKIAIGGKSISVGLKFLAEDCKSILRRYAETNHQQARKPMSMKMLRKVFREALVCIPPVTANTIAAWMADRAVETECVKPIPKIWVDDVQEYRISEKLFNMLKV